NDNIKVRLRHHLAFVMSTHSIVIRALWTRPAVDTFQDRIGHSPTRPPRGLVRRGMRRFAPPCGLRSPGGCGVTCRTKALSSALHMRSAILILSSLDFKRECHTRF